MKQEKEYYAFISYKREDEKWAKWLQRKLEHYRFPTSLNGRYDLPKNICPIFRDVSDLSSGLLAEEINNALRNSEWLIVVCSPRSAKSQWVCKEAQTFIDLGRYDHIIPFVIEGNPFSSDIATECYPMALLNLTGSKELLAANVNEMGRDAAAIKVVACMFNIRFDALWQRYEREQRKRRMTWIGAACLFAVGGFLIAAYIAKKNIELYKSNKELLQRQAVMVSDKAQESIAHGYVYEAIKALLDYIPEDNKMDYVPEVEAALRTALDSLHSAPWAYILIDDYCNNAYYSNTKKYIVIEHNNSVSILNAKSLAVVCSMDITNDNEVYFYSSMSVDDDTLFIKRTNDNGKEHIYKAYAIPQGIEIKTTNISSNNDSIYLANTYNINISNGAIHLLIRNRGLLLYNKTFDYDKETGESFYTVVLYDCKSRKYFFEKFDSDGTPFISPGWGVNNVSLSHDGKFLAVSYRDGVDIINLEQMKTNHVSCSNNEDCDHYSNVWFFTENDQLLHTSAFDIPKFYDKYNGLLLDSLILPMEGSTPQAISDNGNNVFLFNVDKYCFLGHKMNNNKPWTKLIGDVPSNYITLPKYNDVKDTVLSNQYELRFINNSMYVNNMENKSHWVHTVGEKIHLLMTIEDNYIVIGEQIDHGRGWEEYIVKIMDLTSGCEIVTFPSCDECYYDPSKRTFLLKKYNVQNYDVNDQFKYVFKPYQSVIKECRKIVANMEISDITKRKF